MVQKLSIRIASIIILCCTSVLAAPPAKHNSIVRKAFESMLLPKPLVIAANNNDAVASSDSEDNNTPSRPATSQERAKELGRESNEERPDEQLTVPLFGRPLTIGGEVDVEIDSRADFSLENGRADDRILFNPDLELEFLYPIRDKLVFFGEVELEYDKDIRREDDDKQSDTTLSRGQTWLYASNLFGSNFGLQVGRQTIRDQREWWWDEKLDSIRLHYNRKRYNFEISFAEELGATATDEELDPEEDDLKRLLASGGWNWADRQRLESFLLMQNDDSSTPPEGGVLDQDDEDEFDADLTWLGLRAIGRIKNKSLGHFYYWADAAVVRGDEKVIDFDDIDHARSVVDDVEARDVRGWALDLGATLRTKLKGEPRLTAGYAITSNDDDLDDDVDRTFRQTGLQGNEDKFRSVDRFPYYGALLEPELSNLEILTLGVGFPFLKNSSIDVVYHNYRQVEPADFLRDSRLRADPEGENTDIGKELDLVVSLEEWEHWEAQISVGVFEAGRAFGELDGETANRVVFELEYNF